MIRPASTELIESIKTKTFTSAIAKAVNEGFFVTHEQSEEIGDEGHDWLHDYLTLRIYDQGEQGTIYAHLREMTHWSIVPAGTQDTTLAVSLGSENMFDDEAGAREALIALAECQPECSPESDPAWWDVLKVSS